MTAWTEEAILAKGLKLREPVRVIPPADAVTLNLPLPPSTNNLFVTIPKKGRVRSQDYCRWHKRAFDELTAQKAGKVKGRFSIVISVGRIKRRADVDNRSKAILDLLAGVVTDDDSYCERMSIGWSDEVPAERVSVTVRAA
jgi:crossover junction endodeoxyribonuclease RusA